MDGNRGNLALTASRQLYIPSTESAGKCDKRASDSSSTSQCAGKSQRAMDGHTPAPGPRPGGEGPSPRGPDSKSSPFVLVPSGFHSATLMVLGLPVKEVALFPPAARGPRPGAQRA